MRAKEGDVCVCVCVEGGKKNREGEECDVSFRVDFRWR